MRSLSSGDGQTMPPSRKDPFDEYRELILLTLDDLKKGIASLNVKVDDGRRDVNDRFDELRRSDIEAMKIDIAMLKVKAGAWGAIGGLLAGAVMSTVVAKMMG
jgi:hypothetical protein